MPSYCSSCNRTTCIEGLCPYYPPSFVKQGAANRRLDLNMATRPDELKRYGTSNERPVATWERIHELETRLVEAERLLREMNPGNFGSPGPCDKCKPHNQESYPETCVFHDACKAIDTYLSQGKEGKQHG